MQTMYPGKVNSPSTTLDGGIDDSVTTINILDGAVLPVAPNLAVIGTGEDAETILYATKVGNQLSNITRGFQGIAKAWSTDEVISRLFTEYDYGALKSNIGTIAGRKITDFGECNSEELRGKITDETGTGKAVFGTYPEITKINLTEGQIKFPAVVNPSADPNTQDDYEKGEWTPGITFGGNAVGMVFQHQYGEYIRIGKIVAVTSYFALTNKGSSVGTVQIVGLPFTCKNTIGAISAVSFRQWNISFANIIMGAIYGNDTYITIEECTEGGAFSVLTNANFMNNSVISVSATYFAE